MHRFFIPHEQFSIVTGLPRTAMVRGADAHQIKDVLRMRAGDKLELLDGSGKIYSAVISNLKKDRIECRIVSESADGFERKAKVTIAQCLPKAKKMDLIIQKCTELGAACFIPTLSERTIAKGDRSDRWKKIAKESAEQCGRSDIPGIMPLTRFEDVLKLSKEYDLALIPWELEEEATLKGRLRDSRVAGALAPASIIILIGPEGGFSQKEVELAVRSGFKPVTLGKRILRTETAGMAVLSMINYAYSA